MSGHINPIDQTSGALDVHQPAQPPGPEFSPSPRKAVALKYDPGKNAAPTVVAKGKGDLADRILALASENRIPIQEDASLVEVLSKLDIDQEIPPELFMLVAEILTFLYQADKKAEVWLDEQR